MFTGVHVVQTRFLDRITEHGPQCVIRTAYRALFDEAAGLHAFVTDRYWWEHSTGERYLQGVFNVLDGRVPLPYAEHALRGVDAAAKIDPTATIVPPVWIGPDAVVGAGARVGPHVQLGARVQVAPGVVVTRAVAWDDVPVAADLHDAVATPRAERGEMAR
jgi:NDP-sugar pyrophosphorylase family protein